MPLRSTHGLLHFLEIFAADRFWRLFKTFAVGVEEPAVERAAQTAVFQPSVAQIGAPMGALPVHQGVLAFFIAEEHQVFPEQPHALDRPLVGQLVNQGCRLPVAAHELPARCACSHTGNFFVLFAT